MGNQKNSKDFSYYLIVFKLEGHTSYRVNLAPTKEVIEQQLSKAKIVEKKIYRIDRTTGKVMSQE